MPEPFKLNVKLGAYEFSGEGAEASVREEYKQWLAVVAQLGPAAAPPPSSREERSAEGSSRGGDGESSSLPEAVLKRVFLVNQKEHTVSLRVLPPGDNRDADALVLLLFGFAHYFHEHGVLGTRLLKAARVSGVQVERVDRALTVHADKLTVAGTRKGRTYGLNNPGSALAEKLLAGILK